MIYISYKCRRCNKEIILITEDVEDTLKSNKYLSCSHCGSKKLYREKSTDDLRECMKSRTYKRVSGALRQVTK